MSGRRLLVIGARHGSVGNMIARVADNPSGIWSDVVTAGVSGDEDWHLDIRSNWTHPHLGLNRLGQFHDVVCTVGINTGSIVDEMEINAVAPMLRMQEWCEAARRYADVDAIDNGGIPHVSWVNISSNSAHVVRSPSPGYCASKAALSMGTMCIARHEAKLNGEWDRVNPLPWNDVRIWGYEPGLFMGTPMTAAQDFDGPMHRMPDGRKAMDLRQFAKIVVSDLVHFGHSRMCSMQRIDAGDQ